MTSLSSIPAHPRSRGENISIVLSMSSRMGSSPLARGKRFGHLVEVLDAGLIPARAGKTRRFVTSVGEVEAHPRSRGENHSPPLSPPPWLGSSPLTRGKPQRSSPISGTSGLIPAHAGKTVGPRQAGTPTRAHPRSRGENSAPCTIVRRKSGSSPLTRGKQQPTSWSPERPGLIPAHAGKTTASFSDCSPTRAHPRSRGENSCTVHRPIFAAGSSPLTRGKHAHALERELSRGLIPAHAGKTFRGLPGPVRAGAHPRSRGENRSSPRAWLRRSGSSPLTRGKRFA